MRKIFYIFLVTVGVWTVSDAQVRLAAKYDYPTLPGSAMDSVLNGLKSIRGCGFHANPEGDGRSAIAVSNYADNGRVHVFAAVGNDSIQLVWTSPHLTSGGGGSTPRYALFGDLDNDQKIEVIYQSQNNGIFIFEHDGVAGSHNYGTAPSQLISSPFLAGTAGYAEQLEILDIDGDATPELLVGYRPGTASQQGYYVIRAEGDWSTGDPGFSSFVTEFMALRPNLTAWGLNGGSVASMASAQFDGTGNKEILLQAFDRKTVSPVRVPSANTYLLADTLTGKAFVRLGGTADDVALFGTLAYDIDGDGREEMYLPTFPASGSPNAGYIHMVSYNVGENTSIIDSTNVTLLSVGGLASTTFGYGYGDMNLNGKKEIYLSSTLGTTSSNVVAIEFQGGDKRDPANWIPRVVYRGDTTIYTAIRYRDSVGVRDTTYTIDPSFASKIYGRFTDFDNDGREDIILPYQALTDSVTIRTLTWNTGSNQYDTVVTVVVNPKRWGLRVVEYDPSLGVEGKDVTIIMPDDYRLDQNYPNPFNPSTTISFFLPVRSRISVTVYDILGREVRTLINNEELQAGVGQTVWDGRDNAGHAVSSGTYFYTLKFGNFEKTNKMMLLK